VDWKAYVFCVLKQFHRMLRRREIYANNSSKWGDPLAKLLDGAAWEQTKPTVLTSLGLPADGGEHLAAGAARSHGTYREVAERVPANSLGRYSFRLPDLPGGMRPLRDPDAADE
jgi:hypothetical protein